MQLWRANLYFRRCYLGPNTPHKVLLEKNYWLLDLIKNGCLLYCLTSLWKHWKKFIFFKWLICLFHEIWYHCLKCFFERNWRIFHWLDELNHRIENCGNLLRLLKRLNMLFGVFANVTKFCASCLLCTNKSP